MLTYRINLLKENPLILKITNLMNLGYCDNK